MDSAPAIQIQADPIIMCKGLRKVYGDLEAVSGLDLDIPRGNCFGLLGPNGAGKTTTLRMLLGQSPRTSGVLSVFGESIESNLREIRQRTGIVPQADNLDPDFTVSENLRIYGLYFRITSSVLEQRIPKLLKLVELDHRAKDRISTLSGGMKRRLILARALINDPDLLVFDEPTTGLDPLVQRQVLEILKEVQSQGKTVFFSSHALSDVEQICNRVGIIREGELAAIEEVQVLKKRRLQRIKIEFDKPIRSDVFSSISEVKLLDHSNNVIKIEITGDIDQVIKTASSHRVISIESEQSSLEDTFMAYYQSAQTKS